MPILKRVAILGLLLLGGTSAWAQFPAPGAKPPAKPAAAAPADAKPSDVKPSDAQALDRVIDLLKNDQSRNALVSDLEKMRAGLKPAGSPQANGAASTATPAGGTADSADPEDKPNLFTALIEGVASAGRSLPSATFGYPIRIKLMAAFSSVTDRTAEIIRDGSAQHFLSWAVPGWMIAVAILISVPVIPWVARGRRLSTRPRSARSLAGQAFRCYVFSASPVVLSAIFVVGWPGFFEEAKDPAAIFVFAIAPILVGSAVIATLNPALYALAPTRGWRLVSYAQRRLTPWIAVLLAIADFSALLRLPVARRTLGWDVAGIASLLIDLALCALTLVFVLRHRRSVRRLMMTPKRTMFSDQTSTFRRLIGEVVHRWHWIAIAFVCATAVARVLDIGKGDLLWPSVQALAVIFVGVSAAMAFDNFLIRRERRLRRRSRPLDVMMARYLDTTRVVIQFAMLCAIAILCLEIWGFAPHEWPRNATAMSILHPLLMIGWVLLFNWVLWIGLDGWIEGTLANADGGHNGHRTLSARTRTLLPLLRNAGFVTLAALGLLAVLSNLGLNVGPLLAGAGVIGLAVGFGSQELVKDVITGLFILIEDTIAIGDTVNTGDRTGVVEGLTIRTVKLRDGDGSLHSVPFSQIKALKNSSRGYSVYQLKVTIAYDADLDRVILAMREVGSAMLREQRFGADMLAPLDVWGVDDFTAEGVVIKGAIRTKPLRQWGIGREFNRRLKQRLDQMGVAIYARKGEEPPTAEDMTAAAAIPATS